MILDIWIRSTQMRKRLSNPVAFPLQAMNIFEFDFIAVVGLCMIIYIYYYKEITKPWHTIPIKI